MFENDCSFLFLANVKWQNAEDYCKMFGGHLFSFTDKNELHSIAQLLNIFKDSKYWTGLMYDSSDTWSFSDGTTMKKESMISQPRHRQAGKCVYVKRENGVPSLKSQACEASNDFICQFNANSFTSSNYICTGKFISFFIVINSS